MASALFAFDGYVDITNETGFTIYYAYVSHESDEFWGDDMLGDDYLENGDTYRVYLSGHSSSIFDIMLEDEDGDTYTFETVDVEQDDAGAIQIVDRISRREFLRSLLQGGEERFSHQDGPRHAL